MSNLSLAIMVFGATQAVWSAYCTGRLRIIGGYKTISDVTHETLVASTIALGIVAVIVAVTGFGIMALALTALFAVLFALLARTL